MNGGGTSYGLDEHIYQRLLKERIVFLGSEVRDQNANAICAQMLLLNAEDPQADIFLYINSPGGSVDAGGRPSAVREQGRGPSRCVWKCPTARLGSIPCQMRTLRLT